MDLAIVRGQCTATVKDPSLVGRRFALIQRITPEGQPDGPVEVALDVTAAAPGQTVVLARGSAARQPAPMRQLATDLTIVAIIDNLNVAPTPASRPERSRKQSSSTTTGGK